MLAPNNKIISYNSRIQSTQDQNFSSSDKELCAAAVALTTD